MGAGERNRLFTEARREGRDARMLGYPREHNPYRQGPYATKWHAWDSGWHEANERTDIPPVDQDAPRPRRRRRR